MAPTLARPTWIMAREQTAGRGRRGRGWSDMAGNLAATLVFRPDCTVTEAASRSFLAANALFETLSLYIDRDRLAVKWPNDVLIGEGKVAGILLESAGQGRFVDWLSIGFGVNLAHAPAGLMRADFKPVSLAGQGGERVSPDEFLTALASNYATEEGILAEFGFSRIREDWLEHAARLGEVITARTGKEEITGIFDTVDENGNLVLIGPKGPQVIAAADVYF